MPKKLPVIAAIPNYNMAKSLKKLLPQVLKQDYDEIFLLDDASTDNSLEIAKEFKKVKVIAGEKNVGSGANRNRIIAELNYDCIIHFMDADVQLKSQNNPTKILEIFKQPQIGLSGGLIQMPDGTPWMFNYGTVRYSWFSTISGWSQAQVGMWGNSGRAKALDKISPWRHKTFPDPSKPPERKYVFWVGEANMMVRSKLFAEVGGFEPQLRYHEIQDLAYKTQRQKFKTLFDPSIVVEHPQIDLFNLRSEAAARKAEHFLRKKYGFPLK